MPREGRWITPGHLAHPGIDQSSPQTGQQVQDGKRVSVLSPPGPLLLFDLI